MMTTTMMYLITRLDGIVFFLEVMTIISLLVLAMAIVSRVMFGMEDEPKEKLHSKTMMVVASLAVFVVLFFVSVLVPTTKDMAAILLLPRVANSETVRELGDGMKTLALEWMEELRPSSGQKKHGDGEGNKKKRGE